LVKILGQELIRRRVRPPLETRDTALEQVAVNGERGRSDLDELAGQIGTCSIAARALAGGHHGQTRRFPIKGMSDRQTTRFPAGDAYLKGVWTKPLRARGGMVFSAQAGKSTQKVNDLCQPARPEQDFLNLKSA
jgi:hypothetical protein